METIIQLISVAVAGGLIGYLFKWGSGETRSNLKNLDSQSIENILNSAKLAVDLNTAAVKAAEGARSKGEERIKELSIEVANLRARVVELETVEGRVAYLEAENIALKEELKRRIGKTRPIS